MARLKALLEQRDDQIKKAEAIVALAKRETRDVTVTEDAQLDGIINKKTGRIAALDTLIRPLEAHEENMKRLASIKQASRTDTDILNRTQGVIEDPLIVNESRVYQKMARLKAFPDTNEGARDAYACGMWIRAVNAIGEKTARDAEAELYLERIGWHPQMAATEGTDTKGGFLVPQPMSTAIITIRENVGVARRLCDIVPMSSKTEDIPKRTGGLTVYYPGEGNTVTTSDLTFGRVNLNAKKRAVANQISSELSDDALVNMTDRAIDEMGYALADKEDAEFINGDGTSTYGGELGVLNALGTAGVFTAPVGQSTWLLLNNTSISQWKGLLPGKYFRKDQMAVVCTSEFYYSVFDRLMAAAGGNTGQMLREGGLFDIADLQYQGLPIFLTDKMPSTTSVSTVSALYGNFGLSCMFGDRTGVRIGMSMDYAFLDDVTTMLATSRYDLNVHEAGDDSTAGGYVGLSTSAS